jgi:hypothetical protein
MSEMGIDEGAKRERFRTVLAQLTGKDVVYDPQIGKYKSGNSVLEITRDDKGTTGRVSVDGAVYPFGYDPQSGQYFPLD